MGNRKININRPELSSEEIAKGMDFQAVLAGHTVLTTPWYKTTGFIGGSVATVAITTGAVLYATLGTTPTEDQTAQQNPAPVEQAFTFMPENAIRADFMPSPFTDQLQQRSVYTLYAEDGSSIEHHTGSNIQVPADAFLDENGNVVTGKVEIQYIEYHDQVDIFLSSIPMQYDSAGNNYHFESAGMLEIYAFQNGKPVFTNPKQPIRVEMASRYDGTHYNVYNYDTTAQNWVYLGKDEVFLRDTSGMPLFADNTGGIGLEQDVAQEFTPTVGERPSFETVATDAQKEQLANIELELEQVTDALEELKKTEPQEPEKADGKRHRFNLDVLPEEFPELLVYERALFEIGDEPENADFNTDLYAIEWEDMRLTENKPGVNYRLTLVKGNTQKSFIVYPAFDQESYENAMKLFQEKYKDYKAKLDTRLEAEKDLQEQRANLLLQVEQEQRRLEEEWQAEMKRQREEWEAQRDEHRAEVQREIAAANAVIRTENKFVRAFTISNFGIYNSDNPHQMPTGMTLSVAFQDEQGNPIKMNEVFLVEKDRNAVYEYLSESFGNFTFNPNQTNAIWGVTKDNKILFVTPEAFLNLTNNTQHTFTARLIDPKFKTAKDVRELLEI